MVSDSYDQLSDRSYHRDMLIEDWIEELEKYLLARHRTVDNNRKMAAVITYIGPEGKAVISNLPHAKKDYYAYLVAAL